jgi:arylsulfatase A-like enzyme
VSVGGRRSRAGVAIACAAAVWGCRDVVDEPERALTPQLPAPDRPNIVLIIIDNLRADRLGAYGFPAPTSPELDAYSRKGVRFERVVAQSTWTRPSIGSMLTSLHPRTLGLYREEGEMLGSEFTTLAEVLKQNGYWTAGATANPNINAYFNFDQGFDYYVDSDVVFDFMPGIVEQTQSERQLALPRARGVFLRLMDALDTKGRPPFYVQVNLMEVHEFERIPKLTGERYASLANADRLPGNVKYLKALRHASVEIDLFIRRLSRSPGWQDTLFVITSDHGETLGSDHPDLDWPKKHGFLVYESQTLVPLIFYSPAGKLPAGRVVDRPVRLLDLMPTLLDYAGIAGPEGMAGRSLMPLLRDAEDDVDLPEIFVVETQFREADKIAAYSGEWIYIENRDHHGGTNPRAVQRGGAPANGARTDLADREASVVQEHAAYLKRWEQRHPRAEPNVRDDELSEGLEKQLRALGYLQ